MFSVLPASLNIIANDDGTAVPETLNILTPFNILDACSLASPFIVWVPDRYWPDAIVWLEVVGVQVLAACDVIVPCVLVPFDV